MKPIRAEFVRPRQPKRPLRLVAYALTASLAAGLFATWWQHKAIEHFKLALAQEKLAQEQNTTAQTLPASAAIPVYQASLDEMLLERSLPWSSGLQALENSAAVGVTPNSIEFQTKDGSIRVELTVLEQQALLDYVDALNAGAEGTSREVWQWGIKQYQRLPTGTNTATLVGTWRK